MHKTNWMEYQAHPSEPVYDPTQQAVKTGILYIISRVRDRGIRDIAQA